MTATATTPDIGSHVSGAPWLRVRYRWLRPKGAADLSNLKSQLTNPPAPGAMASTADQRAWPELMRDHIATSLSLETEDFGYSPFAQRGGLGKAHQLFGGQLPRLLDELNEVLAA